MEESLSRSSQPFPNTKLLQRSSREVFILPKIRTRVSVLTRPELAPGFFAVCLRAERGETNSNPVPILPPPTESDRQGTGDRSIARSACDQTRELPAPRELPSPNSASLDGSRRESFPRSGSSRLRSASPTSILQNWCGVSSHKSPNPSSGISGIGARTFFVREPRRSESNEGPMRGNRDRGPR